MDFFDKIANAIYKAADKASSPETKQAVDRASDLIGEKVNAVIENLFGADNTQRASQKGNSQSDFGSPKPSENRSYETYMYDSANGDGEYEVRVSFMLSKDFVLSKTNAGEIERFFIYDPSCSEEYTPYELNDPRPYLFISPDIDQVYCSVEEYCEKGTVSNALWVRPSEHSNMLFRAKFDYYGDYMLMYGYKRYDGSPGGICLVYKKSLDGTELCGHLISRLDEAAASYAEIKI